jgi:hypothetical protein
MNKIGFQVSGIDWDLTTDDDSPLPTNLPTEVEVWLDDVDLNDLSMNGLQVSSDSLLERILDEVTDKYGWCINSCTVTVINETKSIEEAIHLLRNLVDHLDEDIPSDEMSRHLKDALNDAKQFLGIEVNDDDDGDDDDGDDGEGEAE